ncbi:uncharacterized protein LOC108045595 isoform X2 [Drosophila rhopaloa]|uniref:Uncharacterized protein LOC108045595 isoform X2 n=1 Tax=Drosophila rhopaloa TaxID=1041015 RepID=A0A6P4EZ82_DRORH|nr:uncharacterized protein LOC108045595 isoform X2 [Drosophila rhopaloa]
MCNLNQVYGSLQRYHYPCCRQKMHPCFCKRDKPLLSYGSKSKIMVDTDKQQNSKESEREECGPCPLNCLLKCPLPQKTTRNGSKNNSECLKTSSFGKVTPRTSITGKKASKASPIQTSLNKKCYISNSLTSQGNQRYKGSCICSTTEEKELLAAKNSKCCARSTMMLYPTKVAQKNRTPSEANKKNRTTPKSTPEIEQNQKAIVKVKPKTKRKKPKGKKMPTRSTAGDDEDDGIWFECNLPFRVNIPFPISVKNMFQSYPGKSNPQIFKALVPAVKFQQDKTIEMPWPAEFLMHRSLPPPIPESNLSISKPISYTKKKGLKRGKKPCPCETSTQTIEEESDPVLCCLEQIRNQLATKSADAEDKNIIRCFAEKSTNVRSILKPKNETDVQIIKTSPSIKSLLDEKIETAEQPKLVNISSASSQKNSSKNTLLQPLPETIIIRKKENNLSKMLSKSGPESSILSIVSQKKSHGKSFVGKNSKSDKPMQNGDLQKSKDAEKEKDLINNPALVSMMSGSICQPHFKYGYFMPRWQYSRRHQCYQSCWQYYHMQNRMSNDTAVDITSRSGSSVQVTKLKSEIGSQIGTNSRSNQEPISLPCNEYPQCDSDNPNTSTMASSNCDYMERSLKSTKSSYKASDKSVLPINPSDRMYNPEESPRSSKSQCSKELSQKIQQNISSSETKKLSIKIYRKSSENISSSILKHGSKSVKSSKANDLIGIKTRNKETSRGRIRNKQIEQHSNRITSGGTVISKGLTNFKRGCKINKMSEETQLNSSRALKSEQNSCEIYERERDNSKNSEQLVCERNSEQKKLHGNEKLNMSNNSIKQHIKQGSSSDSFKTDQAITDINESSSGSSSSKNSDKTKSLESYSSNGENISYGQISENGKDQLEIICAICDMIKNSIADQETKNGPHPQNSPTDQVIYFNKPRSQSAPNQRKNISGIESNLCQLPEIPEFVYRKQNCTESPKCSENVLVLQDETCESESEEGHYNYVSHYRMEKGGQDTSMTSCRGCQTPDYSINAECCRGCQTPDYSINADIVNQLRVEDEYCNPVQRQKLPFTPSKNQRPDDLKISQQDQIRQNPPPAVIPIRTNDGDKWRELKAKLTLLMPNQLQMAPKTCRVHSQNALPCQDVHGQPGIAHQKEFVNDKLVFSSSQLLSTNSRDTNLARKNSKRTKNTKMRKVIWKIPKAKMSQSQGNDCVIVFRRSVRPNTTSKISDRTFEQNNSCSQSHEKYDQNSRQHSFVTKFSVGEGKKNPRSKFQGKPSYMVHQGFQKVQKASGFQPQGKPDTYHGERSKNPRNEESHTMYGQFDFRYNPNNKDSHLKWKRVRSPAISQAGGYTPTQPNEFQNVVPLGDSSAKKTIARSNETMRSTDVETLETVTLMQPRKLSNTESARINDNDLGIGKTFLMATRTPCNRENLLQACGRPPCTFCPHQYTGIPPGLQQGFMVSQPPYHPKNFIDPRDQWTTSSASSQVMQAPLQQPPIQMMDPHQTTNCLHRQFQEPVYPFNPHNSFYCPQSLKENINMLPEGFYDQTVNKYKITRMDSNFQPPSMRSEYLYALQAQQQSFLRHPGSPLSNQLPQQLVMGSVPDPNRSLIQDQLQNQHTMFYPQQNVKLDDNHQSEYHI